MTFAAACGEDNTGMAGDNPLADAREAVQPSPAQPEATPAPAEPYGGLPKQPVVIPTNPPETTPSDTSNH